MALLTLDYLKTREKKIVSIESSLNAVTRTVVEPIVTALVISELMIEVTLSVSPIIVAAPLPPKSLLKLPCSQHCGVIV
jgi:hypothetical protein